MNISEKEYGELVKKASPNSKSIIDIPKAFVIGGIICCIGQAFLNLYTNMGFDEKSAGAWTSVTLRPVLVDFRADRSWAVRKDRKARRRRYSRPDNRLRKRSRFTRS